MRRAWLAAALALAACQGTTTTPPKATKAPSAPPVATAHASPSPTATPAPSAGPTAAAPSATPDATAQLRERITKQLLPVAQLGFMQARAQLISDHGAGLLSDAGAGIISNNAGTLIANNGSGYRLQELSQLIDADARAGEVLVWQNDWVDGSRSRYFRPPNGPDKYTDRILTFNTKLVPTYQEERLQGVPPAGAAYRITQTITGRFDDGRFGGALRVTSDLDENLVMLRGTVAKGDGIDRDDKTGLAADIDGVEMDFTKGSGTYTYRYPTLGLVEEGTFEHLVAPTSGQFELRVLEPHQGIDGQATVKDAAGKLLFTSNTQTVGGKRVRDYDLQAGLKIHVDLGERADAGKLEVDGQEAGAVTIERQANGTHLFRITLTADPGKPLIYGYGVGGDGALAPSPEPSVRPWSVATLTAKDAPYASLQALVPSRAHPGRFYFADLDAKKLHTMELDAGGKATFAPYAPGATLAAPIGLAVGPDDTLYVSEDTRILAVALDGSVSTLAGTATAGATDGPGATASFNRPAGLALDAKGDLYVAEFGSNTIRKVSTTDPAHPVTTLAGKVLEEGQADGAAASARFAHPSAVAVDASGAVIIADELGLTVRRLKDGQVTTIAGNPAATSGNFDGPATERGLYRPRALAFDAQGRLYIASSNIRRLDADGQLRSYAGLHEPGTFDGPHDGAQFVNVRGMAFGPDGTLYVTDAKTVRSITAPGRSP